MKFRIDKKPFLLLATLLLFNTTASSNDTLPDLGSDASRYLPTVKEREVGQVLFLQMMHSKQYVDDLLLQRYIQSLGEKISAHADLGNTRITFSLLENSEINAFASPGGYVTLHTGLLTTSENESELASVLSHEIAHITQMHIPRLFARAKQNQVVAVAGIFASLLVGGQAGLAGLTSTNAALASNQLRYSRDFEQEADALGIDLLARSGFDPDAMITFFSKLERKNQHRTQLPEFLRTHPVSFRRTAEAENRTKQYAKQDHYANSSDYDFAKARIVALDKRYNQDTETYFRDQFTIKNDLSESAANYGLALTHIKQKEFDAATAMLNPLLQQYPDNVWLLHAKGEIMMAQKQYQQAVDHYSQASVKIGDDIHFSLFLADAYLANQQPDEARRLLRRQIRQQPQNYLLHQKLSKSYLALGEVVLALQADIEYYALLGNYTLALARVDLALNSVDDKNSYLASSITARKIQLEQKQKTQKRALKGIIRS